MVIYKIPFRQVYCETLAGWIKEMIWIFFVLKLFPYSYDFCNEAEWRSAMGGSNDLVP